MPLPEAKAKKGERKADAIRRGGELLGEKNEPGRPEKIERPGDRAGDEERGERALGNAGGAGCYPFQIFTSLKYLIAPGWCGRLGCTLPASVSSKRLKFGCPAASAFLFSRIAFTNW